MEENKTAETPNTASAKPYNLEPNVEAALAYVLGALSGIIVLVFEKNNKFVRFHAMQSVIAHLAIFVVSVVAGVVPVLGFLVGSLLTLVTLVLFAFMAYQAYSNKEFELPIIGKIAKQQVNK